MSTTNTSPTPLPPLAPLPVNRGRKRWIALSILVIILILGGIAGTLYWLHARQFEETDDAYVDGDIVPISAQIPGRIKTLNIRDNQDVTAGDLLAEIDSADFVLRVNQAQAAVAAAKTRVQSAQANADLIRVTADAMIVQAKAGVAQAEAAVTVAASEVESDNADIAAAQAESDRRQADVKRYDALDSRAVSQQQRDAARAAADAAAAQLSAAHKKTAAAEAHVTEARSHVDQAKGILQAAQTAPQQLANALAQVKTAEALVTQSESELQTAQQQLSYTRILAPISGRITRKSIEPGQYIEAGQNLCTIVAPEIWVTANFKETQLTHMHQGQLVDLWVDTYPDRTFRGRIASIQAGTGARFSLMPPENATGNFVKVVQRVPVKITFEEDPEAKELLAPGMSATPRVHVAGDEGAPAPIDQTQPAATATSNH